ncbi:MAG: Crp/Fnr family transcriptional regulator [Chitinophagaceae bacterium]
MSIQSIIESSLKTKSFSKGEMVYNQGSIARYFFEVISGEVRIVNSNEEGKEFIQGVFRQSDCFGEPALILNKVYPAAPFSHTDCVLYIVPKDMFFKLLEGNFEFHLKITRILSERLFYKAMMLEEVANEDGEHRLCTLLDHLEKKRSNGDKSIHITKQQLADMSGLRVETVIRLMKRMEEKGAIETQRGKIFVTNAN